MGSRKSDDEVTRKISDVAQHPSPFEQWLEHSRTEHGEAFVDELAHKLKHSTCTWQPSFEMKP